MKIYFDLDDTLYRLYDPFYKAYQEVFLKEIDIYQLWKKSRIYNNEIYYKYLNPKIYQFKDFYTFLELLRTGVIRINMKISFYTSEEKYGKIQDKGTAFEIQDKDIEKLFTIIA